jgi:hypothetical protein
VPGWIIPLLDFDTPKAGSSSFSRTATESSYLESSLAIAHPVTPAPIITTSYVMSSSLNLSFAIALFQKKVSGFPARALVDRAGTDPEGSEAGVS